MRTLTIKRAKSFIACLGVLKVYIEDHNVSELMINNTPCRKLGTLKNGEEKSFEIPDTSAKVYVIADTLSKNYCNDFYQLEESEENVYLSGKCVFNPSAGNPFRFDNNNNPEAHANRKKGNKIGMIILVIAVAVGFVIGFLGGFFD